MPNPRTLIVDPLRPDPTAIDTAVAALRRGDLIVIPTETVYGLAADFGVPGARDKIYAAKGRPDDKAIALLASDADQVRRAVGELAAPARSLAERYWPGPLTLVLRSGSAWTGYRVPAHEVALELLRKLGNVLAVTSANQSGRPPALNAQDAAGELGEAVALILDAGPSSGGVPSTVVRVDDGRVEVLRDGAIPRSEIERYGNLHG